ncbi:MAG: DUF5916 domain-containing protein [Gemmatimonadales bacterium]
MLAASLGLALVALARPGQHDTLQRIPTLGVMAARVTGAVSVDGVLDEAAWAAAIPVTAFVQREPHEGTAASERTEARILYDDGALYVGARLYDRAPDSVLALLARRDRFSGSDRFTVFLDSYHDRRTGFFFGINAAGTLYDGTLSNDEWDDDTWDGVWQGKAARDSLGWTAELRIPYSQLRFEKQGGYRWGINFFRLIARRNERDFVAYRPSEGSGFVSRFPTLEGIESVSPPARLEVLPYATSRAEYTAHEAGDPFRDGSRFGAGAGTDFKLGLGGNLTLAGTVNPDFGQVEVDPAVVNLSDVETFFDERRPFFVEGSSIFEFGSGGANDFWGFNWADPTFLYTRRIGRAPEGEQPDNDFAAVPDGTTILGALKLSGKVGNWSLGTLSALTDREVGRFALGNRRWRSELEPRTYYGLYRAQKEFAEGRRGLGILGTATHRFFGTSGLRDELNADGLGLGVDGWTTLDPNGRWVLTGWAGMSRVSGTAGRLRSLQENSVHYFQRPDASYLGVDTGATSLTGLAGRLSLNKQQGNWMVNSAVGVVDPDYEVNDLGFQSRGDQINTHLMVGHKWTRPGRLMRSWRVNLAAFRGWNFGGDRTSSGYFLTGLYQLRNFSEGRWFVAYNPRTFSDRQSRGGPLMASPAGVEWDARFGSDPNRRWLFGLRLHGAHYGEGADDRFSVGTNVEWKLGGRLSLRLEPLLERTRTTSQYVDTFDDALATGTFGHRYVFGDLDQTTLSASLRLNWIFTPRVSLEVYAQPLLSSGRYRGYKELARPRSYAFTPYPAALETADPDQIVIDPDGPEGPADPREIDDPDFSLASLRGNAVLRWEYLPGSTFFLVWSQNRADTETIGGFRAGHSLSRLFGAKADNIFLVKISYWWNP